MMWLARPKPPVAVAATLILATAGFAVQGRPSFASTIFRAQSLLLDPADQPSQFTAIDVNMVVDSQVGGLAGALSPLVPNTAAISAGAAIQAQVDGPSEGSVLTEMNFLFSATGNAGGSVMLATAPLLITAIDSAIAEATSVEAGLLAASWPGRQPHRAGCGVAPCTLVDPGDGRLRRWAPGLHESSSRPPGPARDGRGRVRFGPSPPSTGPVIARSTPPEPIS